MKFSVTMVMTLLAAGADAVSMQSRNQLRLNAGFGFGGLFDKGAESLTSLAGGNNNLVQGFQQQGSKIEQSANSGQIGDVVNTTSQIGSSLGGQTGQQIGTYGSISANVLDQSQQGKIDQSLGTSLNAIGQQTSGTDAQQLSSLGNSVSLVGNQIRMGNQVGALNTTQSQLNQMQALKQQQQQQRAMGGNKFQPTALQANQNADIINNMQQQMQQQQPGQDEQNALQNLLNQQQQQQQQQAMSPEAIQAAQVKLNEAQDKQNQINALQQQLQGLQQMSSPQGDQRMPAGSFAQNPVNVGSMGMQLDSQQALLQQLQQLQQQQQQQQQPQSQEEQLSPAQQAVKDGIKSIEEQLGDISQLSDEEKNAITLQYVDAITKIRAQE